MASWHCNAKFAARGHWQDDTGFARIGRNAGMKRDDCVLGWSVDFDELTVDVAPSNIVEFVEFLKTDSGCKFSTLVDITGRGLPRSGKTL
jgi:NADH-quinone oxidoreductase subunit C